MRFGSVCSGIEAASVAWHPLGWQAAWLAEIEAFPSAVLAHHYPDTPNLGDMTTIARRVLTGEVEAPDVLTGGTPCQAFSVAGLRESLADERGNLTLKFVELADAIDHVRGRSGKPASIVVWENVPGVLSTKDNAFGCFLAGLAGEDEPLEPPGGRWSDSGCVYGPARAVAWRTLDAQFFGLAQRRRRVFVVASARAGFDPATVLFEWEGVRRDTAPSRQAGQGAARGVEFGPSGGGFTDLNPTLDARAKDGPIRNQLAGAVLHGTAATLDASYGRLQGTSGQDANHGHSHLVPVAYAATDYESGAFDQVDAAGPLTTSADRTRGAPILAFDTTQITSKANVSNPKPGDPCHPLAAGAHAPAIAFGTKEFAQDAGELAPPLRAMGSRKDHPNGGGQVGVAYTTKLHNTQSNNAGKVFEERATCLDANSPPPALLTAMQVRRLTPRECERLQGFPDDYTLIPAGKKLEGEAKEELAAYFQRTGQYQREVAPGQWEFDRAQFEAEWPRMSADGPRYKALGNSWAVPCARWIGQRINAALARLTKEAA
jgi:DNA (cytosine-5)-methyltransferase 1